MSKHVLVVDDDEDVRETLSAYLELQGYEVTQAENGRVALDILHVLDEPPCLLLVDLRMPVMSGWELLDALDVEADRICVTTSAPEQAPKGYDVMPKPVDLDNILRVVQRRCPG